VCNLVLIINNKVYREGFLKSLQSYFRFLIDNQTLKVETFQSSIRNNFGWTYLGIVEVKFLMFDDAKRLVFEITYIFVLLCILLTLKSLI
jgi:hypothetical protein